MGLKSRGSEDLRWLGGDQRLQRIDCQPAQDATRINRGGNIERKVPVAGLFQQVADKHGRQHPAKFPNMFIAPETVPAYLPPISMADVHAPDITRSLEKLAIEMARIAMHRVVHARRENQECRGAGKSGTAHDLTCEAQVAGDAASATK